MGTRRSAYKFASTLLRALFGAGLWLIACQTDAAVLRVGPARAYKVPSEAAARARDGDVIEIDPGVYDGDVAVWRRDRLTIRGVGGFAHVEAGGRAAEAKAIWVIKGRDVVVEHIEFSGAHVPDRNGAGIRAEGENLTVRHCFFHDNENGILGGVGDVTVENSEFARNGFGDGQSHNMYISRRTRRFVLRGSYSHGANVGHNVKSRAAENRILYNRITDTPGGHPSYSIDLPEGGLAYIIGNVIQQAPQAQNRTLVSYGAERVRTHGARGLYIVNNTFVNDDEAGVFIRNADAEVVAQVVNNVFAGRGKVTEGPAALEANWHGIDPGFVSAVAGNYHLRRWSVVIDQGVDPGTGEGFPLVPTEEYVHPLKLQLRPRNGRLDLGAYEFGDEAGAAPGK